MPSFENLTPEQKETCARLGKALLDEIHAKDFEDLFDENTQEWLLEGILVSQGLFEEVVYDPDKHGEDFPGDPDPGKDTIYWATDKYSEIVVP